MAIDLTGVSETLLIPLYAQWRENRRGRPVLRDAKVDDIVDRLKPPFEKFIPSLTDRPILILRKRIIDQMVAGHLRRHRGRAVVVNMGCGLCTRFDRLDDGSVTWIDVDLAMVAPIWALAFEGHEPRRRFVTGSVAAPDFIDSIEVPAGAVPLFLMEGVSMYLSDEKMQALTARIAARFPGATFIFDAMARWLARGWAFYPSIVVTGSRFTWGLDRPKSCTAWGRGFRVLRDVPLARQLDLLAGPLGWFARFNPLLNAAYRVVMLRLGKPATSAAGRSPPPP
ncbi:class I SAM-dependent methyltransferase [Zavarzinia compransoris]|uniref:Class I SAM-dependent methyltransferase n=1 Tax=Zavarzinia compransoris TaxID=1264899 RepID=A0A317EDY7_9PROT|nr:class I SAM-dependent methyltransferase [Zavarzinia compransoris]PWR23563.1 hypothetical protein DKG75_03040 [Zavarzinia compransoris]TDP47775.1 O-methyltransferase involved in polyketide biosynthesis [Zavarzinia compransoris]